MQAKDLDLVYTALAEAMGRVGEADTPLMLATLTLSWVSKIGRVEEALALIKQAEDLTKEK